MAVPSVLLVDHDRDAVMKLASLLTEIGCQVSYTFDPRLALAHAKTCKPDIAFIDLRMPHMTGTNIANAFRAEKTLDGCALVAFSGGPSAQPWATLGAAFQALLPKTALREEVVATIEMLVPGMKSAPQAAA